MLEIKLAQLQEKMCKGFKPDIWRGKEIDPNVATIGLQMGVDVIKCEKGEGLGGLVRFDYVVTLGCFCAGCEKFQGFRKELQVEE